jgi:hypothetical protein
LTFIRAIGSTGSVVAVTSGTLSRACSSAKAGRRFRWTERFRASLISGATSSDLTICNRYTIRGTAAKLIEHFDATLPLQFDLHAEDVVPGHLVAGLLLNQDVERELVPMQFGLAKPVAPEPFDRKWPNNIARIEKFDKWPWKVPFQQHRCIVPLLEFREPCHWGETAQASCPFLRR